MMKSVSRTKISNWETVFQVTTANVFNRVALLSKGILYHSKGDPVEIEILKNETKKSSQETNLNPSNNWN